MTKKRIAFFLIDYTPIGGVERVTSTLISLFNNNNIDVKHLISLHQKNKSSLIKFPDYLDISVLSPSKKDHLTEIISKVLTEKNIDILIFQGDNMSISLDVLNAAKKVGCIAIPIYHGSPYAYLTKFINLKQNPSLIFKWLFSNIQYFLKKRKQRKFIDRAVHGIVCVSKGAANELKTIHQLPENISLKIITIHNPLSFKLEIEPLDMSKKEKTIVYVSRLEKKHKNSMMVVKVWELIAKNNPEWELNILGDGSSKSEMESYVLKNAVPNVQFYGMVNNVDAFLNKSTISLLTSHTEGLGMSLLESAQYKNAIISTKSYGGVVDIVEDNVTGLLSPINDIKSFAENLEKVIRNEKLRIDLANNAFEKMKEFSDTDIINKWKSLLYHFE